MNVSGGVADVAGSVDADSVDDGMHDMTLGRRMGTCVRVALSGDAARDERADIWGRPTATTDWNAMLGEEVGDGEK